MVPLAGDAGLPQSTTVGERGVGGHGIDSLVLYSFVGEC